MKMIINYLRSSIINQFRSNILMIKNLVFIILVLNLSCLGKIDSKKEVTENPVARKTVNGTALVILGTVQDAGSPQIGCTKDCCKDLFNNPDQKRKVISLGLIDAENQKTYLFEATPDISTQMKMLTQYETGSTKKIADGIFLTHAHIGHYTGLMYLGKEAIDAKNMPVFVMPKMKEFLTENGPWSQLVKRNNIQLQKIYKNAPVQLTGGISVTPILVPHRDEYSETVGYHIKGPTKSALFIPDIDKWEKWDIEIKDEIKKVDYAFLDATFFNGKEIDNRDISQIPHPFVIESLETFKELDQKEKNKIVFIHFNHTNPLLDVDSDESKLVLEHGFKIGKIEDVFNL